MIKLIESIVPISLIFLSNSIVASEESNSCVQHNTYRNGNHVIVSAINNCGKTKDVNVCVHIQDNITIDNHSDRLDNGEKREFRFIDFKNKNYIYGIRWCDAGKSNYSATCSAKCEKVESSSPPETLIASLVTEFYKNRGEWAGTYYIGKIEKIRLDKVNQYTIIAHVRYFYIPAPGNRSRRADTGYDQRTFTLDKTSQGWQVRSMGGYMSGNL